MRFTDIMMTIPVLPLMLFAALLFKGGFASIVIILSAFSWMGTARLVRGNFLSLRSQAFVEAAVSSGASPTRIVVRHLIPNSIAVIIVSASIRVSGAFSTSPPSASSDSASSRRLRRGAICFSVPWSTSWACREARRCSTG